MTSFLIDYGPAPGDLQLAPLLDDSSHLEQVFFDPFPLDLPPLQDNHQAKEPWYYDPSSEAIGGQADRRLTHHRSHEHNPNESTNNDRKTSGKSGAPLAEVLNEEQPAITGKQNTYEHDSTNFTPRKIRRIDDDSREELFQLPPPNISKKNETQPRIPPLLQGLHEPPPNARMFPPITSQSAQGGHSPSSVLPRRLSFRVNTQNIGLRQSKPSLEAPNETHEPPEVPTIESEQPPAPQAQTPKSVKKPSRRLDTQNGRKKWTEEETLNLLKGVARFGIGKWKEILACSDYDFNDRSSTDLKDRFRICRPQDYSVPKRSGKEVRENSNAKLKPTSERRKDPPKSDATKSTVKPSENPATESGTIRRKYNRKMPETSSLYNNLDSLGISEPFERADRRSRNLFSEEEDSALLEGFKRYGARWASILKDKSLDLTDRTPRDLRDRFRNRYPRQYAEISSKRSVNGHGDKDVQQPSTAGNVNQQASAESEAEVDKQKLPVHSKRKQPQQNPNQLRESAKGDYSGNEKQGTRRHDVSDAPHESRPRFIDPLLVSSKPPSHPNR